MKETGLSIVKFYAEWSGTCQMMMPVYKELAGSYSKVASFYSVDVDKDPELKEQYGIMELPTVLFFRNGNVIDFVAGILSKNAFMEKIETAVSAN